MKLKTLILMLLWGANVLTSQTVSAQNPGPDLPSPHFGKPDPVDLLTQALGLTDTQKAQVQPLVEAFRPQLEAIYQQARDAEVAVLKQLIGQVRSLLTPEQQAKLDALEAPHAVGPAGALHL